MKIQQNKLSSEYKAVAWDTLLLAIFIKNKTKGNGLKFHKGASRVLKRKNLLTPLSFITARKSGDPFLEIIRMKRLWYDSEALGLESVGLRDLWRAWEPLQPWSLKDSFKRKALDSQLMSPSGLRSVWCDQFLNAHTASQQGQQVYGPSLLLVFLKAKVRLWTGLLFWAQSQS